MNPQTPTAAAPDPPPDWERLRVDVLCPRCGYNLKLLAAPRCPECGLRSTWRELVAAAEARTLSPLFEYQWRRRPARSFFRTLGESMLPWMIWQTATLTARPRIGPLATMMIVALLGHAVLSSAANIVTYYLTPAPRWPVRWSAAQSVAIATFYACLLVWAVHLLFAACLLASALVHQQTLRRCRIRLGHLLRITALTLVGMSTWLMLAWCIRIACDALPTCPPPSVLLWLERAAELLSLTCLVASVASAWTLYLKVRWGVLDALLVLVLSVCLMSTAVYGVLAFTAPPPWSMPAVIPVVSKSIWPLTWAAIRWFGGTVLGFN